MSEVDASAEPAIERRSKRHPRKRGEEGAQSTDAPLPAAELADSALSLSDTGDLLDHGTPEDTSAGPTRAERRRERAAEKDSTKIAKREAKAQESLARQEADAEARRRREEEKAAQRAAEVEARAERREARTSRKLAKRQGRLDRITARVAAKDSAEVAKLEQRHELRARRLDRRAERAEAKAAAEVADLERRRTKRAGRLEKRAARSEAKAQAATEKLARWHEESARSVAAPPTGTSRRARRRERRREAARAVAAAVPTATDPTDASLGLDEYARLSRRQRRRERRREAALERALARVAEGLPPSVDPEREDETLAAYLARVEAPMLPRGSRRTRSRVPLRVRRTLRISLVVVLVAGAAVLPWAVPEVRSLVADALPGGHSRVVPVEDPPVEPPEAKPGTTPVEPDDRLEGVELDSAGTPREVVVPRLHVDSDVVPISGQSGELLPPSDPQVLGWWREGQPVGAAEGSAVITGHTVHTGGGALDHLDKLVVGDSLRVRTDHGWIRYVVQRARIYPTEALARDAEEIFRQDGPGRLVVITCDDWNGEFYESNAVVFATPVADQPSAEDGDVPDAGPDGGR